MGDKKGTFFWVLGLQYLKDYYSIFDLENKRIGFIEANPDADTINMGRLLYAIYNPIYYMMIASLCCCCCCCGCCGKMCKWA